LIFFSSCGSLKQNILFNTEKTVNGEVFRHSFESVTANYQIQVNDRLAVTVFTNKGERLIDPNREFKIGDAPTQQNGMMGNQNSIRDLSISSNNMSPVSYLVTQDGTVNLPMVGILELKGLTLSEAEVKLKESYSQYYEEPYVIAQYLNKRVVLMGALGDQVIPLRNENMTLLEVLSIAGDVQSRSKPDNIRLIRGPWDNPSVKLIDLTSVTDLKDANIIVEPNDIIYVEPRRRIDRESIQDFNIIFTPITTLITLSLTMLLLIREASGS
jgi:polysaccharide export outer membrane protein